MSIAVIYLRVSTERQARRGGREEGFSLPAQRKACQKKARELGATEFVEFVDAGESARSSDRPQLQAMLEYLRGHTVAFVVVHKIDRLSRNRLDDATISMEIESAGAVLVSASENIDDTPSGFLMHGILSTMAEWYSRNLAAEVKKGRQTKVEAGGTPGAAPLGYLNSREGVGAQEIRTITVDLERSSHVVWAFEQFATGEYSLSSLTEALEIRGLVTVPRPTRPEKPVSRSQIHRMLRNPYYVGVVTFKGVEYEGAHEPLIDMKLWRDVQGVLDGRSRASERSSKHQSYLKGSLFCGYCGTRMALTHSRGRGGVYPYFYCLGHAKGRHVCPLGYLPVAEVEAQVERYYQHVDLPHEQLDCIITEVGAHLTLMSKLNEKEIERQRRRLQRAEDESRKLLQAHYAEAISLELLKEEQTRLGDEIARASSIIEDCETEFEVAKANLETCAKKLRDVTATYRDAGEKARRSLNQALFEKLFVTEEGIVGADLAQPYSQLLDPDLSALVGEQERKSVGELLAMDDDTDLRYDKPGETNEVADDAVTLHPLERPGGVLAVDKKNPDTYCRRRGSNVSLLAERGGFEPPVGLTPHCLSKAAH